MTEQFIIKGNTLIVESPFSTYGGDVKGKSMTKSFYTEILKYHKSWDWLIPAFDKFCTLAEPVAKLPRTRIPFCCNFVDGVTFNNMEACYKSLLEGIEWYNMATNLEPIIKQTTKIKK